MTLWRAVQRFGEAAAHHTDCLAGYHADPSSVTADCRGAPATVVVAVDGCTVGMQVRSTRRSATRDGTPLAALPPIPEGHFREVKTGVLLCPADRVEASPSRHTLARRVLVTCLGDADALFARMWAHLREAGWLGAETTIVVIGDGAEWIWQRATAFSRRCEILDFWHAMEYAWAYARLQFGDGTRRAEHWTRRVAHDLKAGEVGAATHAAADVPREQGGARDTHSLLHHARRAHAV